MAAGFAIEDTYSDVYPLIISITAKYHRKYKGSFQDWLSEADLIFIRAYNSFDDSRGTLFSTWLYIKLQRGLQDYLRTKIKTSQRPTNQAVNLSSLVEDNLIEEPKGFNWACFLADLSIDAKLVVEAVVDCPLDIKMALFEANKMYPMHKRIKIALYEFLYDCGWGDERIDRTFDEIKEALLEK